MGSGLLDLFVFSSVWVACAAAALALAACPAMGVPLHGGAAGLAFFGTLVIYNVDRLRDVDRDRATSPERAAFICAHRRALWMAVGLGPRGGAACSPGGRPRRSGGCWRRYWCSGCSTGA